MGRIRISIAGTIAGVALQPGDGIVNVGLRLARGIAIQNVQPRRDQLLLNGNTRIR